MAAEVNWLLVGAGRAGRCLAAAIESTDAAFISGIVDPAISSFADYKVYRSLEDALAEVSPMVAVVAVPNNLHVSVATTLVREGIPTLVEKPVGVNHAEARQLVNYATQADVPLGVILNQRAQVHSRWIKSQIELGDLKPEFVSISGHPPLLEGWQADIATRGAGLARMIGIHYLDLLLWWFGEPSVAKSLRIEKEVFDVDLFFANGCRARITLSCVAAHEASPVEVEISASGINLTQVGHKIEAIEGLQPPSVAEQYDPTFIYGPGHYTALAEASAALLAGSGFPTPAEEILPALKLLEDLAA